MNQEDQLPTKESDSSTDSENTQYSMDKKTIEETLKNHPLETLTAPLLKRLQKQGIVLWEVYPEIYEQDHNGRFLTNKDGTPKRKRGKLKGSAHNFHSETKHQKAVRAARRSIRNKQKKVSELRHRATKKQEEIKRNKETLKKLDGKQTSNKLLSSTDLDALPATVREALQEEESAIIFRPNAGPQEDFLSASEKEVLYGGAAGGGKSYAMLVDPLPQFVFKEARALLIRRTMPELRELIDKSFELYPKAYPGARFRQQDKTWTFPSGAKLEFGYCEKDSDVYRYQGQAYSWIGFDELTQWPTDFCWNYLASRLRTVNPEIKTYLRATANPGNIGGYWVKKRFIDPAVPGEAFLVRNPDGSSITRRFIPAKLSDNPYLSDSDYGTMLAGLPPVLRKQLLEGNWDVVEGAAFPEFDTEKHVIAPFEIPPHWERLKGIDYGFASESACIWAAVDPDDGTLIVYRELYKKGLVGSELGLMITELERPDIRSVPGVLDGAAWSQTGAGYKGPTVGEVLVQQGHKLRRADKNRIAGKIQVHERLAIAHSGRPKLQVFSSCPNLIRELQALPTDKNNPEDVDTKAQDHAYDALRYLIMARPRMEGHMERLARYRAEVYQPTDDVFGY